MPLPATEQDDLVSCAAKAKPPPKCGGGSFGLWEWKEVWWVPFPEPLKNWIMPSPWSVAAAPTLEGPGRLREVLEVQHRQWDRGLGSECRPECR
jgi:hypothetical protein